MSAPTGRPLAVAVDLDSTGLEGGEVLSGRWHVAAARAAEQAGVDFVTFPDALALPHRLDALLLAARVAPATATIGLVPTITVTHTEPFHVSTHIATLDFVSGGRAGWMVAVSTGTTEAEHVGRRPVAPLDDLWAEAAECVEVVRRLWDSWEDDAIIRDRATGRFIDRDRVHYIDYAGRFVSVKGPSITPRPPQGQPLVVVVDDGSGPSPRVGADVVIVPAAGAVTGQSNGGDGDDRRVVVDVTVVLGDSEAQAADRAGHAERLPPDAFVGTPAALADWLETWSTDALAGVRLRPAPATRSAALPGAAGLVAALEQRGRRRPRRPGLTLRQRLGLERPANRYATAGASGEDS